MERDSLYYKYKADKYRHKYLALKAKKAGGSKGKAKRAPSEGLGAACSLMGGLGATGLLPVDLRGQLKRIAPDLPNRVGALGKTFGVELPVKEMEQLMDTLVDHPELRDEIVNRTIPFCLSDADYQRVKYCIIIATDVAAVISTGIGIPKLLRDLVRRPHHTFAYLTEVIIPIIKGQTQKARPVFEDNLNLFLGQTLNIDVDQLQQMSFDEVKEIIQQNLQQLGGKAGACYVNNCPNRRILSLDRRLNYRFCGPHTCTQTRQRDGLRCPNRVRRDALCQMHLRRLERSNIADN